MYLPLSVYFLIFFCFFLCTFSQIRKTKELLTSKYYTLFFAFFSPCPLHLDMIPIHVNPPRNTKGLSSHHSILPPPPHEHGRPSSPTRSPAKPDTNSHLIPNIHIHITILHLYSLHNSRLRQSETRDVPSPFRLARRLGNGSLSIDREG